MLEDILGLVFAVAMIYGLYSAFKAKIWVSKTFGYDYYITLKNAGKVIDLTQNKKLINKVRIVSHAKDLSSYSVQSKLNDETLQKFIMAEYGLTASQVTVQSEQLSGVLGAM